MSPNEKLKDDRSMAILNINIDTSVDRSKRELDPTKICQSMIFNNTSC